MSEERPVLRVIRGGATEEEVAALVAVLAAAAPSGTDQGRPTGWTDRASLIRQPPPPGPGAWRASGWPR